jgi:hypothetical protein
VELCRKIQVAAISRFHQADHYYHNVIPHSFVIPSVSFDLDPRDGKTRARCCMSPSPYGHVVRRQKCRSRKSLFQDFRGLPASQLNAPL